MPDHIQRIQTEDLVAAVHEGVRRALEERRAMPTSDEGLHLESIGDAVRGSDFQHIHLSQKLPDGWYILGKIARLIEEAEHLGHEEFKTPGASTHL